ncbi:MAG: hypothetical protein DLM63_08275 [Solirubrobacterales bacterium]|nr:MAG: hypothetical protein DLM63_08275 [Solirubrobacterales bacterium]
MAANVMAIEPAYVVFSLGTQPMIAEAQRFLREWGVEPLGRYGRWEYSSMGQVMRDALNWASDLRSSMRMSRGVVELGNIERGQ